MGFWDFLKLKTSNGEGLRENFGGPVVEYKAKDMGPVPRVTRQDEEDFLFAKLTLDPDASFMPMMPGCNRVTNSPCEWSRTDPIEDKCRMCGTQFPGWY